MQKFSPRERLIAGLMLLSVGAFAIDRYIWLPIAEKLQMFDRAVVSGRSQLLHDQKLLADSGKIKKDYAVFYQADREEDKASSAHDMVATLKEVESLAKRCGVKINTIKPQGEQGRSSRNSAVFISVESTWDPLMHFVFQIQRSPQLLQIEKANLQGKGEDGSVISAQFVVSSVRNIS